MKRFLSHLFDQTVTTLGLGPSDEELELDRICEEENQKVYRQLEIDLKAITPTDEELRSNVAVVHQKLRTEIQRHTEAAAPEYFSDGIFCKTKNL